jgi:4-hydroxy-3-methylbut-2-enyl diphosphate reductase
MDSALYRGSRWHDAAGYHAYVKIILANPRGFCAGVFMAIDVVDQLLDVTDEPIYVFHEIVHNKHVVERFKDRGVRFIESLDDAPEGAIVVYSAHGVSPAIRKQAQGRKLIDIDATCPLVTKVHAEAIRYAQRGWQILLVGHRNHQEVVGTYGEAPDSIQIVESPDQIQDLQIDDPDKLVFLTQTTLSTDDADVIIGALRKAFPTIKSPPSEDICYATTNRQHAVRQLAPACDLVIVVGSINSSNSVRLVELAEHVGTSAVLIDDVTELPMAQLQGCDRVLVTAGASAPEDLVHALLLKLVEQFKGEVEQHDVFHESVEFGLPGSLKQFMRSRGVDPTGRRISMDTISDTTAFLDAHGIAQRVVNLTVNTTC